MPAKALPKNRLKKHTGGKQYVTNEEAMKRLWKRVEELREKNLPISTKNLGSAYALPRVRKLTDIPQIYKKLNIPISKEALESSKQAKRTAKRPEKKIITPEMTEFLKRLLNEKTKKELLQLKKYFEKKSKEKLSEKERKELNEKMHWTTVALQIKFPETGISIF